MQADVIREEHSERVISSRVVLRWKETDTGYKAKVIWCVHVFKDPDIHEIEGSCPAPELSSINITLQILALTVSEGTLAGTSTIDFQDSRWMSTSLLHSRACQYSTAKAYVFSDSVLCLGKMGDDPIESRKSKIQWYSENKCFKKLHRIDGQPMESEWKIFTGLSTIGITKKIQSMMSEFQCAPENLTGRIIFMSMFTDVAWDAKRK